MFCDQCGGQLTESARFCAQCGAPVPAAAAATPSESPPPSQSWAGPPPTTPLSTSAPPATIPPPPSAPPPPPPQPGWAGPGGAYGYVAPRKTNGFALASMVLGIVWVYWIGSILALVFGYIALSQIKRSEGTQSGRGMAIAGVVLGWVGVAVIVLVSIVAIADAGS